TRGQTIEGKDVKSDDGIAISLSETAEILNCFVQKATIPENKPNVSKLTNQKVSCGFDFIEPGQGFNISVLYTGSSAIPVPRAIIAGIPNGISGPEREKNTNRVLSVVYPAGLLFTMVILFGTFVFKFPQGIGVLIYLSSVFIVAFGSAFLVKWLKKPPPQAL